MQNCSKTVESIQNILMFHVNALTATKFSIMIKTRSLWLCSNKVDSRKIRVGQNIKQLLETISMIIDRVKAFNNSNKKCAAKSKNKQPSYH